MSHDNLQIWARSGFLFAAIAVAYGIILANWPDVAVAIAAYALMTIIYAPAISLLPDNGLGLLGDLPLCILTAWAIIAQLLIGSSWSSPLTYWSLLGCLVCVCELPVKAFIVTTSSSGRGLSNNEADTVRLIRGVGGMLFVMVPAIVHVVHLA